MFIYPRPMHIYSVAGWYPAIHVCFSHIGDYLFWCFLTHAHVSQAGIQSLAGILQCKCISLGWVFNIPGVPCLVFCVPWHQYRLLSTASKVSQRNKPYQRRLSLKYDVWVDLEPHVLSLF